MTTNAMNRARVEAPNRFVEEIKAGRIEAKKTITAFWIEARIKIEMPCSSIQKARIQKLEEHDG